MARRVRRKLARPTYRNRKNRQVDAQKWILNLAIFCISIVIVGFMFSMGKRITTTAEKVPLSQISTIPPEERPIPYVVMEVLNGSGVGGVAQKFTNYIRQNGFDVIYTGNADRSDYDKTVLIARTADGQKLYDVNAILMLSADQLFQKLDSTLQVDVSLVIGKDFRSLPVFIKIEEMGEKLF